MKVLILGATGLVGKALMKELPYGYDVYGTYHSASNDSADNHMFQLSVQDTDRLVRLLEQINPDIVISCLRGEFNKQLELHRKLALVLSVKENSRLLFCSTANVFDALTDRPHYEADELRSDSDYGQYKIECEKQIKGILKDRAIILRLPMLWGKSSRRYNELIGQLTRKEAVSSYNELYMNTNTDVLLAKQIRYIIEKDLKGVFHLGASDVMNYHEFIKKIIQRLGYQLPEFLIETLPEGGYYMAVLPSREDMPKELDITNRDVIEYLTKSE